MQEGGYQVVVLGVVMLSMLAAVQWRKGLQECCLMLTSNPTLMGPTNKKEC